VRVPIIRPDADGTITDGTAELVRTIPSGIKVRDFRDLDGNELILPPKSSFEVAVNPATLDDQAGP
jgi:hypothetical protein